MPEAWLGVGTPSKKRQKCLETNRAHEIDPASRKTERGREGTGKPELGVWSGRGAPWEPGLDG